MANKKSIAVWIRRNRTANGMTQSELAEKLGYSNATPISNWERRASKPNTATVEELEALFGRFDDGGSKEAFTEVDLDQSNFSQWLLEHRKRHGLTLNSLSEKSGVNVTTIWQIENGRINYPQEKTRAKLFKALGGKPFDLGKPEVIEDNEEMGKGLGEFLQFNPHDKDDWPNVSGVYVLYDISDRPIYVGKGSPIKNRIKDHKSRQWYVKPFVEKGAFIEIRDNGLSSSLEKILIKFMKSNAMVNVMNVERDED
jgi:transcriptional regulator with XRE-family HTH domain